MKHSQIPVRGGSVHVAETGATHETSVLFLHGWPQDWSAWTSVLEMAGEHVHALAVDLPGIGQSIVADPPAASRDIADVLHQVVTELGLGKLALVGHDIGGQVAYAYLRRYSAELEAAVVMDVVIPGISPWEDVIRNPAIWHFAFHAVPRLPELLVGGRQRAYFDFFYDALAKYPDRISSQARARYAEAYARPEALSAGFGWYRAFPRDAAHNSATGEAHAELGTPLLYVRGEHEPGDINSYVEGFRTAGLRKVRGATIADCGHFAPDEQPAEVYRHLFEFLREVRLIS